VKRVTVLSPSRLDDAQLEQDRGRAATWMSGSCPRAARLGGSSWISSRAGESFAANSMHRVRGVSDVTREDEAEGIHERSQTGCARVEGVALTAVPITNSSSRTERRGSGSLHVSRDAIGWRKVEHALAHQRDLQERDVLLLAKAGRETRHCGEAADQRFEVDRVACSAGSIDSRRADDIASRRKIGLSSMVPERAELAEGADLQRDSQSGSVAGPIRGLQPR